VSRIRTVCLFAWWFCPSNPSGRTFIWWFFGVPRVHDLESQDPWFPLIESVSVDFLWWRASLGGNKLSPKFCYNLWGESRYRLMGSWGLTRSLVSWERRSNRPW
jgi:hypothetical protein